MHELAVVQALVDEVLREVARLGVGGRVAAVHLKLGKLTTFVPAAVTFYFDALAAGTPLEGAGLVIEEVPVAGTCRACGAPITVEELPFICRFCGSPDLEITAGRELVVDALEIRDGDG